MGEQEILRSIVVKISLDKKKIRGTGFLVSENEIATCHHVLALEDNQLPEFCYIKNDDWSDWIETKPIKEKCRVSPHDTAALRSDCPLRPSHDRVPLASWNRKKTQFISRGYDCKTNIDGGASTIEGPDCEIVDRTSRGSELRLQLRTIKKTLLPGRSGSPIWSITQSAVVGMIDYQAGDENIWNDKSMAIPIENMGIPIPRPKGQPINVPNLPIDFLPRNEDLKQLRDLVLAPGENRSAIAGRSLSVCQEYVARFGIQGMGGIGKSVLAAALANNEQIREVFLDGVIWIALGQQPNLPNRQLQLLRFLEKEHRAISDIQDGLGCLKEILCNKQCLLILDDVWTMEGVRAFDALGQNCRLLITTRNRDIIRGLKAREYLLDVLSEDESLQLLSISSGQAPKDLSNYAKEIMEECDRLPLALAMVGAMARYRPDRWDNIIHKLRSADLVNIKAEFPDYPYPNLLKAIEVSVNALEPDQQRQYLDLAVFPEDSTIPEAALQALWGIDKYEAQDLIDLFTNRSLARLNNGGLSLHDLQHDFISKRAGNLLALHNRLLDAYREKSHNRWHSGPNDGYFFQHLAYHLSEAGLREELRDLLLSPEWMRAKIENIDFNHLLSDYEIQKDDDLDLVKGALRLSSHVLSRDPTQLCSQVYGRLMTQTSCSIQKLLEIIGAKETGPWLRTISPSLIPPGGSLIGTLIGHKDRVRCVTVTPDGHRAASGSDDKTVILWDIKRRSEIRRLKGHSASVVTVAISADGKKIVSGSNDLTARLWDWETGKLLNTLNCYVPILAISITSDGRQAIVGLRNGVVKLWDLEKDQELMSLQGHTDSVIAIAITPEGHHGISGSSDGTVILWDLENGKGNRLMGHNGSITSVAISQDGKKAISGSSDSTAILWDLEKGSGLKKLSGHTSGIKAVAMASDGSLAISGSRDRTIILWDTESGNELKRLDGHSGEVNAVALTRDKKIGISGSRDGTVRLWDIKSGKELRKSEDHAGGVTALAISQDGNRVLSGSFIDNTIMLWDTNTGKEMMKLKGHKGGVKAMAFSLDGLQCVSASNPTTETSIRLWDLKSGNQLKIIGHIGGVIALRFTQKGCLAVTGEPVSSLFLLDLNSNKKPIRLGRLGKIKAVALTEDGKRAVIGNNRGSMGAIELLDLERFAKLMRLRIHNSYANAVSVNLNGDLAISGSNDCIVRLWDLKTGTELLGLKGHTRPINAVAFTPNNRVAISGSDDRTMRLWDVESGKTLAIFSGEGEITTCAASGNRTFVVGDASGRLHFLHLEQK